MPTLPTSLEDLKDWTDKYKQTKKYENFLSSKVSSFSLFISFAGLMILTVLGNSVNWFADGTFKSAPKHFYQHYIIQANYKHWSLPGCFTFLSGKSFEIYSEMITQLKEAAMQHNLTLNPANIYVDFEQGAIKAFKFHFPSANIRGCHFHFSSAIYKNSVISVLRHL